MMTTTTMLLAADDDVDDNDLLRFFFFPACTLENSLACPTFSNPTMFYPYPDWQDLTMIYVCNSSGVVRIRRCQGNEIYNPYAHECVTVQPVQLPG